VLRRAAVVTVLGLLAACSLVPGYESPETGVPAAWQESGKGAGVWPDADWWKGFGSPELDGLIVAAAAGNLDLAAAVSRVLESEAQAKIAGAPLYPSLGAGAGVSRSEQPNIRGLTFGGQGAQTLYNASLSAAYEVDLWEKNRAAADAAVQRVRSSQFDQQTVAITLDSNVATTYFQILSLRDRVRLAEGTLKSAEGILDLLEQQRRVGTVSDLEVAQQRAAVATQRAAIPTLVQAERQAIHALAILLGRNPEGFAVESKSLDEARLPSVAAGIPSALLERRPDLRKAESDLVAAHFDIANARAQRFPSISLTADGGTESLALSGLLGPGSFLYTLAASATAPIFAGGQLQGQEELTRARYRELLETYRQAILSAFRDVEDSLAAVQGSAAQYGYDQEAYAQAKEAYRLAELRYRAGAVDFLTVLQAQQTMFQTEDALVQADLGRFNAIIGLYKALGGGWGGTIPGPPEPASP
jgi:NodT family efflux transporter outer membrane factor (OMF) lipoprotein